MSGEGPDVETGQRSLADSESESSTYESAKDMRSISSEIDIQIEESTEEPSLFDDEHHQTDFVLVYKTSSEKDSGPHRNIRQIFEANLEDEGLELEHVHQCSVGVNFVKIHAPWEVLTRYAEIIKMKMPIKEVPEFQLSTGNEKEIKGGISGVCHSISHLFASKTSKRQQFTTEYRRAREYLFDVPEKKEDFFNPAQRAQIVDFILKRKRFSNNTNESYAFGITKLIKDRVTEAAFPLHEVS
ncbi:anoctamin-6-like [Tachypleus tridentatus]|uniref:anoctamin-6-like n=1 Tax=Tachypleus tridentatus TaxID=6853 RepID=UPI003FCF8298